MPDSDSDAATAPPSRRFHVQMSDWKTHGEAMSAVRHRVFIQEQHVPEALEWDGLDPDCHHAVALSEAGEVVGTGRLLADGRIGRMAVLAGWRGHGVGAALLQALLRQALRRGDRDIHLHAQVDALGFYARAGFVATGGEFLDAGILHRTMNYQGPPSAAATSTRQS